MSVVWKRKAATGLQFYSYQTSTSVKQLIYMYFVRFLETLKLSILKGWNTQFTRLKMV